MVAGLLSADARGVFVIAATPFADDGTLDLESTDRLTDFYLECGAHGLTILGMMGEAPHLTADESLAFVARVVRRVGSRVPVVVGVSQAGLRPLAAMTARVMELGASGVMISPPPGLKTDEQVQGYFETVFGALGARVPVCLQDHPQSSGVHMSAPLVTRLLEAFPQVVVFKHEDCPGLHKLSRIRAEVAASRRAVSILVGNGALYYPQEMRRGADGAMTGFAFPEMLVEVYKRFAADDAEGAEDLFDAYLPLVRYEQQPGVGLAIRKEILFRRGLIASPAVRATVPALDADDHRELDGLLTRLERRIGLRLDVWRRRG